MTNQNEENNKSRRHALQKIVGLSAIGGASTLLTTKWFKPAVDAVILPAHAQTSNVDDDTPPPAV